MRKKLKKKLRKKLKKVHRYLGLVSFIFIINFCLTGILLSLLPNKILEKRFTNSLLSQLYNLEPKGIVVYQTIDKLTIAQWDNINFKNNKLYHLKGKLLAISKIYSFYLVISNKEIIVYNKKLELIERLNELTIPYNKKILQVFSIKDGIIIKTDQGIFQSKIINNKIFFTPIKNIPPKIQSLQLKISPPHINQKLRKILQNGGISLGKILNDLHTGKILGLFGQIITNIMVLILSILAISGLLILKRK